MTNKLYEKYFEDYFNTFEDELLIEMALIYPLALKKMCILINIDLQMERERIERLQKKKKIN